MIERLAGRLENWRNQDLYRELHSLSSPMDTVVRDHGQSRRVFCSNNYLGLANHPKLREAAQTGIEAYGVGSGASQLVVGHTDAHRSAETAYANFLGFEDALFFNSGYTANLGVIQAITERGDRVFQDRLNHASLLDGSRLSDADFKRYRHCDAAQLDQLLQRDTETPTLVISDAVFSMEGDQAPLRDLVELRKKHHCTLMVDDAHGVGVFGNGGRGSLSAAGLAPRDVDLWIVPLGKAFGAFGCLVLGQAGVIDALRQFTRSYIYTTALPAALAQVAEASVTLLQDESWRVDRLNELIRYFRTRADASALNFLPSQSAIQSLLVGEAAEALQLSALLDEAGFLVTAIRPPTVPAGQSRLRFTLNVGHEESDIDELFAVLERRPS